MPNEQQQVLAAAYDRFGADVYRYLAVVMGHAQDAENVAQEVFLRLSDVARRDPEALKVRPYVLRVARNEAYRALCRRQGPGRGGSDGLLAVRDPRAGSENERLAIEEALMRLPCEQRETLHLKVFMKMTFEEIAEFTDVSPNTAASRYRYAVEKLRGILGEEEEGK